MKPLRIVLTGKMTQTRDKMHHRFETYGIQVQRKITDSTDYLVMGINPGHSKERDAAKKNVATIRETDFINMMIEEHPEYML